jgi:hypothetical protein
VHSFGVENDEDNSDKRSLISPSPDGLIEGKECVNNLPDECTGDLTTNGAKKRKDVDMGSNGDSRRLRGELIGPPFSHLPRGARRKMTALRRDDRATLPV